MGWYQRVSVPHEQDHTDIVTYLLKQGAPWNAQDKEGNSAGDYALEHVCSYHSTGTASTKLSSKPALTQSQE